MQPNVFGCALLFKAAIRFQIQAEKWILKIWVKNLFSSPRVREIIFLNNTELDMLFRFQTIDGFVIVLLVLHGRHFLGSILLPNPAKSIHHFASAAIQLMRKGRRPFL